MQETRRLHAICEVVGSPPTGSGLLDEERLFVVAEPVTGQRLGNTRARKKRFLSDVPSSSPHRVATNHHLPVERALPRDTRLLFPFTSRGVDRLFAKLTPPPGGSQTCEPPIWITPT